MRDIDPVILEAIKLGLGFFLATSSSGCVYLISSRLGIYLIENPILTNGMKLCLSVHLPMEPICCEDAFEKMRGSFMVHVGAWKKLISNF